MEMQFNKSLLRCLRRAAREYQTQEQTQEVRLPEGMPDVGNVLACWGQVILRGKEWRSETVGVTGGVNAQVLYLPEGGGAPQSLEVWLPFQMKWNIQPTQYDGTILAMPVLRGADARSLSARKLLVRTNVGIHLEAVAPGEAELYSPPQLPPQVQLRQVRYPLRVPKEAGEKAFLLEETLEFSSADPTPERLMRCSLQTDILEKKLMGDKAVFRGVCTVHALYLAGDGQLYSREMDIPFSQYAELEGEYSPESDLRVLPMVTNLEAELLPQAQLHIKAGITGQYMILEEMLTELTQDAYCLNREMAVSRQQLQLPSVLALEEQTYRAQQDAGVDMLRAADVVFWPEQPYMGRGTGGVETDLSGTFQLLYYDTDGQLQCIQKRWEEPWQMRADEGTAVEMLLRPVGKVQASPLGGESSLQAELLLDTTATAEQSLTMVTGLELGEELQPDPARPSLLLRRAEGDSLWQIAKTSGSTEEAIRRANALQQEPVAEQMLLIPII